MLARRHLWAAASVPGSFRHCEPFSPRSVSSSLSKPPPCQRQLESSSPRVNLASEAPSEAFHPGANPLPAPDWRPRALSAGWEGSTDLGCRVPSRRGTAAGSAHRNSSGKRSSFLPWTGFRGRESGAALQRGPSHPRFGLRARFAPPRGSSSSPFHVDPPPPGSTNGQPASPLGGEGQPFARVEEQSAPLSRAAPPESSQLDAYDLAVREKTPAGQPGGVPLDFCPASGGPNALPVACSAEGGSCLASGPSSPDCPTSGHLPGPGSERNRSRPGTSEGKPNPGAARATPFQSPWETAVASDSTRSNLITSDEPRRGVPSSPMLTLLFSRVQSAVATWPSIDGWIFTLCVAALIAIPILPLALAANLFSLEHIHFSAVVGLKIFVAPSLLEELLWRVLLNPHPRERRPQWVLLLWATVSTGCYVAAHPLNAWLLRPVAREVFYSPGFLAICGILGAACWATYQRTGSLWPPLLLHWVTVFVWLSLGGRHRAPLI